MRTFFERLLLVGLLAAASISNVSCSEKSPMTSQECTIMRVAERYIAVHYPDFDSIQKPPVVQEQQDTWLVYYRLPEGVVGGTPEVIVDKRTLKVVRAYRTQ